MWQLTIRSSEKSGGSVLRKVRQKGNGEQNKVVLARSTENKARALSFYRLFNNDQEDLIFMKNMTCLGWESGGSTLESICKILQSVVDPLVLTLVDWGVDGVAQQTTVESKRRGCNALNDYGRFNHDIKIKYKPTIQKKVRSWEKQAVELDSGKKNSLNAKENQLHLSAFTHECCL